MPKPVKKALKRLPVPPKPKRPPDPNRAAHAMLAEHLARVQSDPTGVPELAVPPSFEEQYRVRMAELGKKGGKISGAKRMQMPARQRKAIARKAATKRWAKKNDPAQS